MLESNLSRRSFIGAGIVSLTANLLLRGNHFSPLSELVVNLEANAPDLGEELVSFGVPLPPNFLWESNRVRILSMNGEEISAAVRSLELWRIRGRNGSIRSLLVQFKLDFRNDRTQQVKISFHQPRQRNLTEFVPVEKTLIDRDGLRGPRVMALLPPRWLCDSLIVGPQTPITDSAEYRAYDDFVDRNFPGSLNYLKSQVYHEWLFDRSTAYFKMYVRSGEKRFLQAAFEAVNFVRLHTRTDGNDAGIFTLKGSDIKYVYPRAMHIHYLLTGDDRALSTGKLMAQYCLKNQDPVYHPEALTVPQLGVDPERNRRFWTLRNQGYGLLGILHGWEMTGERVYWRKAIECVDAYVKHQRQPPDGRPADGSLRQDWELYDPNEAKFKGATSPWMMALLLDPLFHYWTLTADERVPQVVIRWCDFLDRQGMVPDGTRAYYVVNCFAPYGGEVGPDMEMHNPEMCYTFALGCFFTRDHRRQQVYLKRFNRLFPLAVQLDVNHPARAFNWAFQVSSQLVYFMKHPGGYRSGVGTETR
jgi:hypothetical protein